MKTQEEIHEKGFNFHDSDYAKTKIGVKSVSDAALSLGVVRKININYGNKQLILKALAENNLPKLREISDFFYATNGIYAEICNYVANMYRYDWYVVPEMYEEPNTANEAKTLKEFTKTLAFLDNTHIKSFCADIALKVVKYGCYYGYVLDNKDQLLVQELPPNYCRVRYTIKGKPAVEFNMRYFDEKFSDTQYRLKILSMFPDEFAKGYVLYKKGKLHDDVNIADSGIGPWRLYTNDGWYLLDPDHTVKFNLLGDDRPRFVSAIPELLDLDAAQDLDRKKQMQQLLKIIVQKLPLDKNGDLIFDIDEAKDIHNNAVEMLRRAIGVDILTTFADIDSIDISDKNTTTQDDALSRTVKSVYRAFGISKNLFDAEGNLSLATSVLEDESTFRNLLFQFVNFFDSITQKRSQNRNKYNFRFYMLETTQYNYKDLSKMFKEQMQNGYSKMLAGIALGESQSSIINTIYFENKVLHLSEIMIPPLMSSTMNAQDMMNISERNLNDEDSKAGRPEKDDTEKSEKTIQNLESQS